MKVDYVFVDEHFNVLAKDSFERIIGITEELTEAAKALLDQFDATGLVDGLDQVRSAIQGGALLLRRFAGVARSGDYRLLDDDRIKTMQVFADEFGLGIVFEDGKIKVKNAKDIDTFIKLLIDAYVQSGQTGDRYCAPKMSKVPAKPL